MNEYGVWEIDAEDVVFCTCRGQKLAVTSPLSEDI